MLPAPRRLSIKAQRDREIRARTRFAAACNRVVSASPNFRAAYALCGVAIDRRSRPSLAICDAANPAIASEQRRSIAARLANDNRRRDQRLTGRSASSVFNCVPGLISGSAGLDSVLPNLYVPRYPARTAGRMPSSGPLMLERDLDGRGRLARFRESPSTHLGDADRREGSLVRHGRRPS